MPGGTQVGSLYTSLTLESQSFYVALKKAGAETEANVAKMQKSLSGLTNALKVAGAALALDQLRGVAQRALEYASSLGEVAQQLGVTTKDLQVYRYAATQVGIAQEDMDKGLAKLTLSLGKAEAGSKAQIAAFNALGISLDQINGKTAGDVIPLIAEGLARIPDPAHRAAIEVELFGKIGQRLDTLLSGGSQGVQDLADAAERLGIILSSEDIQRADDAADKIAAVNKVLEAQIAKRVSENADAIINLAQAWQGLVDVATRGSSKLVEFINLARYRFGDDQNGKAALLSSSSGRQSLLEDVNQRLVANQYARASTARGTAVFGGPNPNSGALDAEYRRLVAEKNDILALDRKAATDSKARPRVRLGPATPLDLSGGGGRRSARVDRSAERGARDDLRFARELASLQDRELSDKLALTQNAGERADLEKARLALDREAYASELQDRIRAHDLTAARAKTLLATYDQNQRLEKIAIDQQRDADLQRQSLELITAQIDSERDDLRYQLDMARTAEERRAIEKKLLDLQYEKERFELQSMIAIKSAAKIDTQIEEAKLARLDLAKAQDSARIDKQNMGPLAQYLDQLPKNAAELNEAYQRVAVDGLGALNDGLAQAIAGTKSLGDVFNNVANQILADLLRIAIQRTIIEPLGNALSGLFGGGRSAGTGLVAGDGGIGNARVGLSIFHGLIPGFAQGGSFMAGGIGGIDRNILSVNGIPRARVSANERISVTPNGGGGALIRIEASPFFDARVIEGAHLVVTERAPGIAAASVAGAQAARFRSKDRELG
ncbi:MAG: hypothetical protein K2Y20_07115 [Sphingomonas sp.]|nr:hypothetical protein [Sphingomonas sp.]